MPSVYLQSSDYSTFGIPNATANQIIQSSIIIDGYLQRPEGMIYSSDANGNPCYMTARIPAYSVITTGTLSPGTSVIVNVTGGTNQIQVGDVAIIDKSTPSITEACVITAINGQALTIQTVQFSHSIGATLDFGLTIFEEKKMPSGRPITTVSRWPVLSLLSGRGRYGYGRRSSSGNFAVNEYNLLAAITSFGGPPIWEIFDASLAGIDTNTGNLWVPAGVLLAYYTDINIWYVAGWTYANLPYEIKQACANVVNNFTNQPIYGDIKSLKAGDTGITFNSSSYIDANTRAMLTPYMTRTFA